MYVCPACETIPCKCGVVVATINPDELSTLRTALARAEEQNREKDKEIERLKDEVDFRNGESGRLVNRINQMSEAWTLTESARVAAESRSRKLEEALIRIRQKFGDNWFEFNEFGDIRHVLEEGSQP